MSKYIIVTGGVCSSLGKGVAASSVDVIGTFTFPDESGKRQNDAMVTCTILQNVLVLATGRTTAKMAGRMSDGSTQNS